ncbi:MAG: hypothetical protein KC449_25370, partial [Anaerolineales bacterium]|nr:hypothetical protein [Anaerolineales bacterium]
PEKLQKTVEIISLDIDEEGEEPLELSAETTLELLQDAQEENYEKELSRYTEDQDIEEALEERQALNNGRSELQERLTEHHATSPTLSGGDVDAAWEDANVGEETAGGMAPTPDQDDVDEIGEAYGIEYEDDEPLRTGEKLAKRDEERWELNPASAEENA